MTLSAPLSIEGDVVTGELAIVLAPGTVARDQQRAIDDALKDALYDVAAQLGAVLVSSPHRYTTPLPGKDEQGRMRFRVAARVEGGRLVPAKAGGETPSKKRF